MSTDDMKWETLSSEYLIRRPWLTARRDKVRLPNGVVNDEFYILEYPDWVNVIAITTEGKYVLVRQYRHGIRETRFELPAGVIEPGEDPIEGAKRELQEETGYGGGEWTKMMSLSGNASTTNNLSHTFLAVGVEKVSGQHLDATEDIEVHLLARDEVYTLLENNEIRQALMAAPLWKHFADAK